MNISKDFMLHDTDFVSLDNFIDAEVILKLEGLNSAGSIKLKTAYGLIKSVKDAGLIKDDTVLIESSSGNLGCALAMVCAKERLNFTCVIDPNAMTTNVKMMNALGANIHRVNELDINGGYLGTRIDYIKKLISEKPNYIWLNQYANKANPNIHSNTTAKSIDNSISDIDYLFVGAGTTGTLMGCLQYFTEHNPKVQIFAVDTVGSVTFGGPASKRYIPGLGTSQRPPLFHHHPVPNFIMIPEVKAVAMCRWIAKKYGLVLGGSTGSVLAGIYENRDKLKKGAKVVAISPDMGEKYLDTIYDEIWPITKFSMSFLEASQALPPITNPKDQYEYATS